MPSGNFVPTKPVLVVVEGKDDERFFGALIKHLSVGDKIEIIGVDGRSNFSKRLEVLSNDIEFRKVVLHLVVVRDANSDQRAAFQSVQSALRNAGLPVPQRPLEPTVGTRPLVTVLILPGDRPGGLEDLCLESVASNPAMPCVESYFDCLRAQGLPPPENLSKAKVHAFLASREKPGLRLGEAAEAEYWPWKAEAFKEIQELFLRIANDAERRSSSCSGPVS